MSFLQLSSKATLQALFISCSLLSFNSQAATPLSETLPPLNHKSAPQSFDQMWGNFDPRKEALEVEVIKEWEEDGVILKVLRYHIGTFKGQKAKMAAVYGYPKGAKKLPGLLQIHGGGQYADHRAVLTNAKRGYATLSIAWAGRLSAPDYKVSPHEVKLFWDKKTSNPHYKLTTDWGALDAYHAPSKHGKDAFPSIPVEHIPNCAEIGTLNTIVGIIAMMQANEVIKIITHTGKPLINQVLIYNIMENSQFSMKIKKSLKQ